MKRLPIYAAIFALIALVLAGCSTSSPAPTKDGATLSVAVAQGAYVGAANPTGLASFAKATSTTPTIATDYLTGSSGWAGLDGSGGSLNWLLGPWKGTGYTLSLGVPIVPTTNGTAVGTLAIGATGAYNSYFTTLAQTLVAGGAANAYLRLGWEFDGSWTTWAATTPAAEASYAAYFQQIVTTMRAVSGEHFRFVWNPDAGAFTTSGYSVSAAWPGAAYVDVIGLDQYDQTWVTPQTSANSWNDTVLPALNAAQKFAVSVKEPIALTEWGVIIRSDGHGLGDDPSFITNMATWMANPSNNVTYESYFDFNASGLNSAITGGSFPNSLAAFVTAFGSTTPTTTTTSSTTSTTKPTPPPTTTPTTVTPTTLPPVTTTTTSTTVPPTTSTTTTTVPRAVTCSGAVPSTPSTWQLTCSG